MTRPHARAGQPYLPPLDCAQAGCNSPEGECLNLCMRKAHELKPLPVEMHEPELKSVRDSFLKIFKKVLP